MDCPGQAQTERGAAVIELRPFQYAVLQELPDRGYGLSIMQYCCATDNDLPIQCPDAC